MKKLTLLLPLLLTSCTHPTTAQITPTQTTRPNVDGVSFEIVDNSVRKQTIKRHPQHLINNVINITLTKDQQQWLNNGLLMLDARLYQEGGNNNGVQVGYVPHLVGKHKIHFEDRYVVIDGKLYGLMLEGLPHYSNELEKSHGGETRD